MSGGDKLAELAAELALRGVDTDTVLAVLKQGAGGAPTERAAKKEQPRAKRDNGYVTHEQVLTRIAEAGLTGMTKAELVGRFPDANPGSIARHVARGLALGNLFQNGDTFVLTKAGRTIATSSPGEVGRIKGHANVLAKLRELGPSTATALKVAAGFESQQGIRAHLERGEREGTVIRHETTPTTWSVAGAAAPKQRGREAAGLSPNVKDGGPIRHEDLIERVRAGGVPLSVKALQAIFGASEMAIRLHLQRGVHERELVRHATNPVTWTAKGARGAKPAKPAPARKGENSDLIVAALKTAGKPLDRRGVVAAVPKFRTMDVGAVYMALSNAAKAGAIVRLGTGLYGLPGKGAPAPKSPKPAASAPAKKESRTEQKSEPARKPENDRQLELVPPAGALN